MRKILFCLWLAIASSTHLFAQDCSPSFTIEENFNNVTFPDMPECWVKYFASTNNLDRNSTSVVNGFLQVNSTWGNEVYMPEVENMNGILTFKARAGNGSPRMQVIAFNSYTSESDILGTYTPGRNFQTYTLNLSDYTGTSRIIGFRHAPNAGSSVVFNLDDVTYESLCPAVPAAIARTKDVTLTLDETGNASLTPEDVDNGSTDECSKAVTLTLDKTDFDCSTLGENIVLLTATATSGQTHTRPTTVTVLPYLGVTDSTYTVYLDNTGNVLADPALFLGTEDAASCADIVYELDRSAFSCNDLGDVQTVVFTAKDQGVEIATREHRLNVLDTIKPAISGLQTAYTFPLGTDGTVTVDPVNDLVYTGTDNCSYTSSLSDNTFSCGEVGDNTVQLILEDPSGNLAVADVTITITSDVIQQVVSTDAPDNACTDGTTDYTVTVAATEVDRDYSLTDAKTGAVVAGPLKGDGGPLNFSTGNIQTTTTYQVVAGLLDAQNSAFALITDLDFAAANREWDFDYSKGYTWEANLNAQTDNTSFQNILFTIGTTTESDVEVYFQGNTNYLTVVHNRNSAGVRYNRYPAPQTNTDFHLAIVFDPQASTPLKVYYDGQEQSAFFQDPHITSAFNSTAVDPIFRIGRVAHAAFNGTGKCKATFDEVRIWEGARSITDIQTYMDQCVAADAPGLKHYYKMDEGSGTFLSDAAGTLSMPISNPDESNVWADPLVICPATCQVAVGSPVTIGDVEAPEMTVQKTEIFLDENGNVTAVGSNMVSSITDSCTPADEIVYTLSKETFSCEDLGENRIAITATDKAGNAKTDSVTVTVSDNTVPVLNLNGPPGTISSNTPLIFELNENGSVKITIDDLRSTVSDNCDTSPAVTLSPSVFTCDDLGTQSIAFTVTDASGNTLAADIRQTEDVIIRESMAPVVVQANPTISLDASGQATVTAADLIASATDNCTATEDLVISFQDRNYDCNNIGFQNVSLSVTDGNGNRTDLTTQFTITDDLAPTVTTKNITVFVDDDNAVRIDPSQVDNGSADNCSVNLSLNRTVFTVADLGDNQVTLTATDPAGNTAFASAVITIAQSKDPQTVTFPAIDPVIYGTQPVSLAATASTGLPITFTVVSGPGTIVNQNELEVNGAGEIVVRATQPGNSGFAAAEATTTVIVNKAVLTASANDLSFTYPLNSRFNLDVSYSGFVQGDNAGDLDQLPVASVNLGASPDAGSYPIVLSGGSDNNYDLVLVNGVLTIERAVQIIFFAALTDLDLAVDVSQTINASSDSGLPVTFTISQGAEIASISGNSVTVSATGTVTVTASQAGATNYLPAQTVSRTFTVTDSRKQDQTITFPAVGTLTYGNGPITLSASATSGLAVSYTVTSGNAVALDGNTMIINAAGTVEISALQAGNGSFNPAEAVKQTITIDPAELTVTADNAEITEGDDLPDFTFSYTGFVNGDDTEVLTVVPEAASPSADANSVGTYPIVITREAAATNYTITHRAGTLTVNAILSAGEHLQESFIAYPNPATDQIRVKGLREAVITLLDSSGRILQTNSYRQGQQLDVSHLRSGVYYLRISDGSGVQTLSLIRK